MRVCKLCGKEKALEDFLSDKSGNKFGKSYKCKSCYNATRKRKKYPYRYEREHSLKRSYGLSVAAFNAILVKQNHCCAICKKHESQASKGTLFVDHCHTTGKIRGLLCNTCNTGIGLMKDSCQLLINAIEYLSKN